MVLPAELAIVCEDQPLMEEQEYAQFVMSRAIEVMQRRFTESVWRAFMEHKIQGRPAREVAIELGLPDTHVYSYASRVLRILRQDLAGLLDN